MPGMPKNHEKKRGEESGGGAYRRLKYRESFSESANEEGLVSEKINENIGWRENSKIAAEGTIGKSSPVKSEIVKTNNEKRVSSS